MDPSHLRVLLERLQRGEINVDTTVAELAHLPFTELGFATVDHHRALRQGAPEVILGQGKSDAQIEAIARELSSHGQNVLITRLHESSAAALSRTLPSLRYSPIARIATLEVAAIPPLGSKPVALISAGTSDLPVAEECAETLRMLGASVLRFIDVGVAGIHRLLHKREQFATCPVIIVVAGMEGALPSVVGGLVETPVIAVPTSVGYGASFYGMAALLGMLNSCASGITVVNIDNGFGAAFAAARILRTRT